MGFEPTPYRVKSFRSDALDCMATADWWWKGELLPLSTYYNFPSIANCKRAPNGPETYDVPTDREL